MTACTVAMSLSIGSLWGAVLIAKGLPYEFLVAIAVVCAFVRTVVSIYKS